MHTARRDTHKRQPRSRDQSLLYPTLTTDVEDVQRSGRTLSDACV